MVADTVADRWTIPQAVIAWFMPQWGYYEFKTPGKLWTRVIYNLDILSIKDSVIL